VATADFIGYGGTAVPDAGGNTTKEVHIFSGGQPIIGVDSQKITDTNNLTGRPISFAYWKKQLGVNTLIRDDGPQYLFDIGEVPRVSGPSPLAAPGDLGNPTYETQVQLEDLADWIQAAKAAGLNYILPIQNVQAITKAISNTGDPKLAYEIQKKVGVANEWNDKNLIAVSIQTDEPNGGGDPTVFPPGSPTESIGEVNADVGYIHRHKKPVYINLAGPTFEVQPNPDFYSNPMFAEPADILSVDLYPANRGSDMSVADQGTGSHSPVTGYDYLALVQGYLHSVNPSASLEAVLECSDQDLEVNGNLLNVTPTANEMGDEYITALKNDTQGICWFPEYIHGTTAAMYDDFSNPSELAEMVGIDKNFLSGGATAFGHDAGFQTIAPEWTEPGFVN
jgi:hypothetical protein